MYIFLYNEGLCSILRSKSKISKENRKKIGKLIRRWIRLIWIGGVKIGCKFLSMGKFIGSNL